MALCPYPHCLHLNHVPDFIGLDYPRNHSARWRHDRDPPCCEWCAAWRRLDMQTFDLITDPLGPIYLFTRLGEICFLFDEIHDHYKNNSLGQFADDINGHSTSRKVEELSRILWLHNKANPAVYPTWRLLAEELNDMANELQIGPPRKLYYTMPKFRRGRKWW